MKRLRFLPIALLAGTVVSAAETGDFDGDGKLTIADVRNFLIACTFEMCVTLFPPSGMAFAPGSTDLYVGKHFLKKHIHVERPLRQ